MSTTFRWVPENPEPWYSEQMGVFLNVNRVHPNAEDAITRWAFRQAKRYGRVPSSYGAVASDGCVFFKGDLSPL